MPKADEPPVAVEQCDRDAAAAYLWECGDHEFAAGCRAGGENDKCLIVQAFVRHRRAALSGPAGGDRFAEGVEAAAKCALEQRCERDTAWDRACTIIAAAIRNLTKNEGEG